MKLIRNAGTAASQGMFKLDIMRWAVSLWLLMIFALAMAPLSIKLQLHTVGHLHMAGHSIAFLITAGLLLWNARGLRSEFLRFGAAVGLAFLMEFLENLLYHAGFEWHDIIFDLTGIMTAWVITSVIRSGKAEPASSAARR